VYITKKKKWTSKVYMW